MARGPGGYLEVMKPKVVLLIVLALMILGLGAMLLVGGVLGDETDVGDQQEGSASLLVQSPAATALR